MGDSTLAIGVLLPDVLGTYGDGGNATVLAQRARWRGIDATVVPLPATTSPAVTCDIYLLGGGENTAQRFAVTWLDRHPTLLHTLEARATTLAVCAGMQVLGRTVIDEQGHCHAGLGMLDLRTASGPRRAVGEIVTSCRLPGVGLLTGFENHRGVTDLGPRLAPLADVVTGVGNGAADRRTTGVDGAVTDHIIATYLHGPVLARNPALADHLLHQATGQVLEPLDMPAHARLRRTLLPGASHRSRHRWQRAASR